MAKCGRNRDMHAGMAELTSLRRCRALFSRSRSRIRTCPQSSKSMMKMDKYALEAKGSVTTASLTRKDRSFGQKGWKRYLSLFLAERRLGLPSLHILLITMHWNDAKCIRETMHGKKNKRCPQKGPGLIENTGRAHLPQPPSLEPR